MLSLSLQSSCSGNSCELQLLEEGLYKQVNHKGRTNFTMANRFYNFIWSLFFRIWNEYSNILAAEFDINKGSSI